MSTDSMAQKNRAVDTEANGVTTSSTETFIGPDALLEHWQGHQRLTRRTIEAFPEDQLFTFMPAEPMRPFGVMMLEVVHMVEPTLSGLVTGTWVNTLDWEELQKQPKPSKNELLELWDRTSDYLREQWPRVPASRFHEVESAFGLPPGPNRDLVLYQIDNEIHHRAQGYVYLRLLGLEPPAFYER